MVRLSLLTTGHLYPQNMLLVLISVTDCVDHSPIVRSEGFLSTKIFSYTVWAQTSELPI